MPPPEGYGSRVAMALGGTCPLEPNKSRPLAPGAKSGAGTRPQQRCGRGAHRGVQDSAIPQPPASIRLKMPRAAQPLSLLVLLVLIATAQGQSGRCPRGPPIPLRPGVSSGVAVPTPGHQISSWETFPAGPVCPSAPAAAVLGAEQKNLRYLPAVPSAPHRVGTRALSRGWVGCDRGGFLGTQGTAGRGWQ